MRVALVLRRCPAFRGRSRGQSCRKCSTDPLTPVGLYATVNVVRSDNTPLPWGRDGPGHPGSHRPPRRRCRASGLSLRRFAQALGTSPSRLSSYRTGRVAPSAAFLLRAERIANALRQARRDSVPTILDAMESIRRADSKHDDDWTYALALEARDRLRDTLRRHRSLAATWEIQPPANVADRWRTLVAAFVSHEFTRSGLPAPPWTEGLRLATEWVLDTPRLSEMRSSVRLLTGWPSATSSSPRRTWSPCDRRCPRATRTRCGNHAGSAGRARYTPARARSGGKRLRRRRGCHGARMLATALNIPGDNPEATRTEALAIGRWAQEFAQSLRNHDQ